MKILQISKGLFVMWPSTSQAHFMVAGAIIGKLNETYL